MNIFNQIKQIYNYLKKSKINKIDYKLKRSQQLYKNICPYSDITNLKKYNPIPISIEIINNIKLLFNSNNYYDNINFEQTLNDLTNNKFPIYKDNNYMFFIEPNDSDEDNDIILYFYNIKSNKIIYKYNDNLLAKIFIVNKKRKFLIYSYPNLDIKEINNLEYFDTFITDNFKFDIIIYKNNNKIYYKKYINPIHQHEYYLITFYIFNYKRFI